MNPDQPHSSHYVGHQTQQQVQTEHTYPSAWVSSHAPPRYDSAQPTLPSLPVVTMNVYAIPFAYTVNNEPLFLQFGTHSAMEAAHSAANLRQRYWQVKTQPVVREDYAYSPATVNRSARACDPSQVPATDRYEHYEPGSMPRPQPTYDYQYPAADAQARTREYNTTAPRSIGHEMNPQPAPQPQRVYAEPDIARSVVPDIAPAASVTVAKDGLDGRHLGSSVVQATNVNRSVNYETEDKCSDRSGRGPGAAVNVLKEQNSHHESSGIRDTSHRPLSNPKISYANDASGKTTSFHESEKPSRSRGSKRYSDGNSNETQVRSKRGRLHWSPELHAAFLAAVEKIGSDKAVPTTIIREMGVEGLSRENVASHLQKHRSGLKKAKEDAEKKELVETLKTFMQSDPSVPRQLLSDEDVLKEAAARQRCRKQGTATLNRDSVPISAPHTPIRQVSDKEPQEPSKTNSKANR